MTPILHNLRWRLQILKFLKDGLILTVTHTLQKHKKTWLMVAAMILMFSGTLGLGILTAILERQVTSAIDLGDVARATLWSVPQTMVLALVCTAAGAFLFVACMNTKSEHIKRWIKHWKRIVSTTTLIFLMLVSGLTFTTPETFHTARAIVITTPLFLSFFLLFVNITSVLCMALKHTLVMVMLKTPKAMKTVLQWPKDLVERGKGNLSAHDRWKLEQIKHTKSR